MGNEALQLLTFPILDETVLKQHLENPVPSYLHFSGVSSILLEIRKFPIINIRYILYLVFHI